MPHQPSFLGNSRTCSNAVISTHCQDKFAIRCLLADSLKNLLAAFADGIAVFHLLHVRWITLRVSRRRGLQSARKAHGALQQSSLPLSTLHLRVGAGRRSNVNVTEILDTPSEICKFQREASAPDHLRAVVSPGTRLPPGHRRPEDSTLLGLLEEARVRHIGVVHLPRNAQAVRPDAGRVVKSDVLQHVAGQTALHPQDLSRQALHVTSDVQHVASCCQRVLASRSGSFCKCQVSLRRGKRRKQLLNPQETHRLKNGAKFDPSRWEAT